MSQPSLLIVDSDLSTPAMVEASCDATQIALCTARDVESARDMLEEQTFDAVMLSGGIADAAELLVELLGQKILWLGSPDEPGAEMASAVIPRPLDVDCVQAVLEEHLDVAQPSTLGVEAEHSLQEGDGRLLDVEAERDALLAEIEVLRHETGRVKREAVLGAQKGRSEAHVAEVQTKLNDALHALDTQRRTAEALQAAYGEVEQAHGKLLQRYEALEAERDALADRAREASLTKETLELTQRKLVELESRFAEMRVRAENAERVVGIRADAGHQSESAGEEAGWWQDAVSEVATEE